MEDNNSFYKFDFIVPDDGCSYYKFTWTGQIGKYDPKTGVYYMLTSDNRWEVSGVCMRWIIDAAYDYEELFPERDEPKSRK